MWNGRTLWPDNPFPSWTFQPRTKIEYVYYSVGHCSDSSIHHLWNACIWSLHGHRVLTVVILSPHVTNEVFPCLACNRQSHLRPIDRFSMIFIDSMCCSPFSSSSSSSNALLTVDFFPKLIFFNFVYFYCHSYTRTHFIDWRTSHKSNWFYCGTQFYSYRDQSRSTFYCNRSM